MSNVELTKLYQDACKNGHDWNWIVAEYRKTSETTVKDATIRQELGKRIVELRKALLEHGVSEEKVAEVYPRMRRKVAKKDHSEVIEFLQSVGQI